MENGNWKMEIGNVKWHGTYRPRQVSKCNTELLNEAFLVKITNSNVMPTLRGFLWYPYYGAQEKSVAFQASK